MKPVELFFVVLSVIPSTQALAAAPSDGVYETGCFHPRHIPTLAQTMRQSLKIKGDLFSLSERFYSDGTCQTLTMVSYQEGLLAKSEALPSTRAISSVLVNDGPIPADRLAANGGPLFLRKISPGSAPEILRKEAASLAKPAYYEAYGRAEELNDIAEVHVITQTKLKFRFSTYNLAAPSPHP